MLPLAQVMAAQSPLIQIQQLVDALSQFMKQSSISHQQAQSFTKWILRLTKFHNYQHPAVLQQTDIESYLSSLAIDGSNEPATQEEAVKAFYFLYNDFLEIPLCPLKYYRIKQRRSLLERFSYAECQQVIQRLNPVVRLMAELALFGKIKLPQVVRIRLSDINMKANRITIRNACGKTEFQIIIPLKLILDLRIQLMRVKQSKTHRQNKFDVREDVNLLFPLGNEKNIGPSVNLMQLLLLKNELKMAIRQCLVQSKNNQPIKTHQVVTHHLVGKTYRVKTVKMDVKDKVNLSLKLSDNPQVSFKLNSTYSLANQLNRGAA